MNPDDLSFTGKIKAASKGRLKLIDDEGCVLWIDTYNPDDETAYVHHDDGDSWLMGWDRIKQFEFVPADNSHLTNNEHRK